MPPNQRRPTGADRIAVITSAGLASVRSKPSAARASGESAIVFAAREKTPPPVEIRPLS